LTVSLLNFFFIILTHFVFDWLQPRSFQNQKHQSFNVLAFHTLITTLPLTIVLGILFTLNFQQLLVVFLLNYLTHFLIDWVSSNIVHNLKKSSNKTYFKLSKEWWIIAVTALDQVTHLSIILFTLSIIA
jgi:hypothetical protein